jgi:hypothetical protein
MNQRIVALEFHKPEQTRRAANPATPASSRKKNATDIRRRTHNIAGMIGPYPSSPDFAATDE